jgi:hypothetical protein
MTYYLQRPVILVDYWDEFTFGLKQQPNCPCPPSSRSSRNGPTMPTPACAVAIISRDRYKELQQRGVPMRVVADARRMVIANQ